MRVVGIDPSLRNWGIAEADLTTSNGGKLVITNLTLCCPVLPKTKQVRQNSLDLLSAHQIFDATVKALKGAQAVFVEVPHGSQSARAMASYGICVGVLGALRGVGVPFYEVSAAEVKQASVGNTTASKIEMIEWAMKMHPEANWPLYKSKGASVVSEAKAEHVADAVAAIYAGLRSNAFRQVLSAIGVL